MIRTMLVDDEQDVRDLLQVMLDLDGRFEVVGHARDGAEAIEVARAQEPDVVLLDLQLPGVDGLAALAQLRYAAPSAKIVVFSAFPDPFTLLEVVRSGADGYLDKSRAWAELIPTLINMFQPEPAGAGADHAGGEPSRAEL